MGEFRQRWDPFYWLARQILITFHRAPLQIEAEKLVIENTFKHANILLINLVLLPVILYGVFISTPADRQTLLIGFIPLTTIEGLAWYSITFANVPRNLLGAGMQITFLMYTSYTTCLNMTFVTLALTLHPIFWIIFGLVLITDRMASTLYDMIDVLRAGLSEAQLEHALLAIADLQDKGIRPVQLES